MMRNYKYIIVILCLCFFGKVQAQVTLWTSQETEKAQSEVELINDVITLTTDQKSLLTDIILEKNASLQKASRLSTSRRNWSANVFMQRIEDILRYGYEIDRNPNSNQKRLNSHKEILAKEVYLEKVVNNDELLQKLNLNIINN